MADSRIENEKEAGRPRQQVEADEQKEWLELAVREVFKEEPGDAIYVQAFEDEQE